MEMGFSDSSAREALIRFSNNLEMAMNHLIDNGIGGSAEEEDERDMVSYPSDTLIESESE